MNAAWTMNIYIVWAKAKSGRPILEGFTNGKELKMKGELEYLLSTSDTLGQYIDRWISVVGSEIVAEGETAKEVFLKAKQKYPDKTPFVMKVPSDVVMVM
jgi:hypothetical protein